MFTIFLREIIYAGDFFTGKQMEAFMISGILTEFSIVLSAVFYVIMGVIPAAKVRNGGKIHE